jgi:hypothetical protein
MSYGTDLSITLPTVGVTAGPTWASTLNTAINAIVAILETKVTPAGMDINADLSFRSSGTSYFAKDLKGVRLTNQDSTLSASTYPNTLFASDADGELYYNDNGGRQVQMTTDGSVNVSTSGGITGGGYGSSGVAWNWDAGSFTYIAYRNSATPTYASVYMDDLKLNDGDTNILTVAAPAMAGNYTLTLPSAVPAANNTTMVMDNTGVVTNTSTPSVATVTTSGLITAGGGVTASADQNITVSGTGYFAHGTQTMVVSATAFQSAVSSRSHLRTNGRLIHDDLNNTDYFYALQFPSGNGAVTIRNIEWVAIHTTGTSNREYAFQYTSISGTAVTSIETDTVTTSNATITTNTTTDHTLLTSRKYDLRWKATEQNDTLLCVTISYDVV